MVLRRIGTARSARSAKLVRIRSVAGASAHWSVRASTSQPRAAPIGLAVRADALSTALGEVAGCALQVGRAAARCIASIVFMSLQGWTA
ncbi:hypothetical protein PK69_03985 [Xanthomonas phaseoli pv. phaseoli]|uniref:Secreted protein n=1 Tax=Xanthomonas campestris pv. phaseoli TaxID=317013 RepID=A0AB34QNT3_XANCH|nr:hypothetical protein AC609_03270 [Xanthomonas phaseoli pv. phaseoli]AZU28894.1 hypothetical protein AC801_03215 [Xanthomonas sp. ISO98C4]AZU24525.1 hypothetical protein AC611_03275 [Xanthomonas phaseoli pv. phaseoli]AZU33292.1 hypothetical protein AC610_03270 [Xanthomonas phaseoli pv. phaseoli]KGT49190.1 hypothetical protein NZ02_21065 [Xanthomonas phaseoli pv. phaseoli]